MVAFPSRIGRAALLAPLALALIACASNPYSYDREYVPRSEEEPYMAETVPLTYEEIRRDPAGNAQRLVSWFGTVVGLEQRDGETLVAMELRFHQARPLCRDQFDSSCRVTVSDRTGGPFSALVTVPQELRSGKGKLGEGALVRVYGHPTEDLDDRGGPILRAEYFRHWPHGTFVFASNQNSMRR